jgi:histone H3/H4
MSRDRLNDIIARRKLHQQKKNVPIQPKIEASFQQLLIDEPEERVVEKVVEKPKKAAVVEERKPEERKKVVVEERRSEDDLEEEIYLEEPEVVQQAEVSLKKGRGRPAGIIKSSRDASAPVEEKESPLLPKQSLIRLIKSSGIQHISADVVDTSIEILQNIIESSISANKVSTAETINNLIIKDFGDDKHLPEEAVLPAATFQRFVNSFYLLQNSSIKRDAFFLLHLYCEAYLVKMIKAADIVASNNKRSRIQGADLTVAFHIYNM